MENSIEHRKLKSILTVALICMLGIVVKAQDLNSHYLYQLNWLNINPAYTGETDGTQIIFNPGTQWTGTSNNPSNGMLGIHGSISENQGLGGKIILDQNGIFNTLTAEVMYAYKTQLTENQRLSFGVTAGVYNTTLDEGAIFSGEYTDLNDPTFGSNYYNETQFLASIGVLYDFKDLEIGISLPHAVVSGRDLSDHFIGTAKYDFHFANESFRLSPMLVYQNLTNSDNIVDIGGQAEWNELVWAQVTYRTNETMSLGLGFNFKGMEIGYLYNMFNGPASEIANNSQQIYIAFTFAGNKNQSSEADNSQDYSRLNAVLNDLKEVSDSDDSEVQEEIKLIQSELAELITKLEEGTFTKEDDARLAELEERIAKLKKG